MHKSNVLAAIELVAIKFCIFFWLPEYVGLKHDTSFLSELPDGYKFETALADLIDNSLQAVWSNGKDERMFIRGRKGKNDSMFVFVRIEMGRREGERREEEREKRRRRRVRKE
ncbi:hypothetical protein KSS87_004858 [Heliosperma pusillum]|nr:hypothetical protein KSS87_004858 [Heliosperma pusillum]